MIFEMYNDYFIKTVFELLFLSWILALLEKVNVSACDSEGGFY